MIGANGKTLDDRLGGPPSPSADPGAEDKESVDDRQSYQGADDKHKEGVEKRDWRCS